MSSPKIRALDSQMVATPSDWRDSTMPSQEQRVANAKTHDRRSRLARVQESRRLNPCQITPKKLAPPVAGSATEVERSPGRRILAGSAFAAGEEKFTTGQLVL